ncbi:ISL3 family transposase [Virgibacillus dokdonensis]|uniref:ISL3 family transposase n=2 Tax=Virgibacillus dokdonensis TaxID=302167 RepID=UPI000989FEF6|nr:ISL3 family transposase [Virgibacillus dokdonensis]
MNFTIKMPGLEDVWITKVEEMEGGIALHVEMPVKVHKCPSCGKRTKKVHDYRIQKIKHLKWFERLTYLFYKKRRYACSCCGKRFAEENPFVHRYQRLSMEWNRAVSVRIVQAKTFKETAKQFGVSVSTVMRRFDRLAVKEMSEVQELPKVIAIDEYKGDTKAGKYQLIIADGETKEPIDILPNRKKKTLKDYLQKHGTNVDVVIMDMSPSFKAAVQKALGKPVIVADRFHFCRYIYWALDGVRRRIQSEWNDYDRKKCKRMRYVFYKDSAKLTEKERWYLDRYLGMDEELRRAYELKESYCFWFKQAKENGQVKIKETKQGLLDFYRKVEQEGLPEFEKAIRTFKNWQTEVLNSFLFDYSNGFLEGINNLTKVMKRNAFGFRNFLRARARILLLHKYKKIGSHVG